jgi:hypothetical protein
MSNAEQQREREHNRLLRRADWRFLLAQPRPARSVCFCGGLLRRSVAQISGDVVDPRRASDGECDLAVAVNPGEATLRRAWASLRPGGACYIEQYLPAAGGASGLQRRMERIGFERVACYWPWPSPNIAPAQLWFPLGAPGALRFFLAQRPPARGLAGRTGRTLRQTLWLLGLGLHLTLPICAVAHRPMDELGSAPVQAGALFQGAPEDGWDCREPSTPPGRMSCFLMTGGARSTNKIVGLVFREPNSRPDLAIKMARVPAAAESLLNEAAALQEVHARRPDLPGVPRVLFQRASGGTATIGETALAGLPVFTHLRRDTYRHWAAQATSWLIALAGRPEPAPHACWWGRVVTPALDDFAASFGPVADESLLRRARGLLESLGDLPLVIEQRDFGPWNVLATDDGGLGVLDWESAEPEGLPGLDLIYFLTYLAFFLDDAVVSGRLRESYRAMLSAESLTGQVARECLARYAEEVGIDPAAMRPLRVLAWMLHARSEYSRLAADAGGRPKIEALRESIFLGLWEEELRYGGV